MPVKPLRGNAKTKINNMNQTLEPLDIFNAEQLIMDEPEMASSYVPTLYLKMKPLCLEDCAGNFHIELPKYQLEGVDNDFYMSLLRDPKSLEEVRNLLIPKPIGEDEPLLESLPLFEELPM